MNKEKPNAPLIGANGNIFNLMGIASRTLKRAGLRAEAGEMRRRVVDSGSYEQALVVIGEYVNFAGADEPDLEPDDEPQQYCEEDLGMELE